MNQLFNVAFVRFITENHGGQEIWPGITKLILNHTWIPYIVPSALILAVVAGIIKKNDGLQVHAIALSAIAFCAYLVIRVFASLLPFCGSLIGKIE